MTNSLKAISLYAIIAVIDINDSSEGLNMATITIRNLNEETKKKIRLLAAQHGHSMEEEVRRILNRTVNQDDDTGLGTFISEQFREIGGIELKIPSRSPVRSAPILIDETT
jgi:plasmid stability protein